MRERLNDGELIPFEENDHGVIIRVLGTNPKIVIPRSLVPQILHLAHAPQYDAHPVDTKLYRTLRRHFYWPSLSVDALMTVRNFVSCARNRIKLQRKSKALRLFPANGPLEYVSIDILGPLVRTRRGNRFLLVISDRYTKLTRTVPLARITSGVVARAFAEH